MKMYKVMNWDTREVMYEFEKLATARRYAKGAGHIGKGNGSYFSPVAYVEDENGYCVYNPRFSMRISSAVGNIINSNDDHLR